MIAFMAAAVAVQQASIRYADEVFTLQAGETSAEVLTLEHSAPSLYPAQKITLNYGGKIVQLDTSGITLRDDSRILGVSRLAALPLSPRVASAEERAETARLSNEGKRELGFTSISGYQSIGSKLYLLARWGSLSDPWLECVVLLDMSEPNPSAQFIGRLPGYAFAGGPVDDRLVELGAGLAALVNSPAGYGLAQMDISTGATSFRRLGETATTVRFLKEGAEALALWDTPYGAVRLTMHDIATGRSSHAGEVRGAIKSLVEPRYLRYVRGSETVVLNLETGAEKIVEGESAMASTPFGLLVWSPAIGPRQASLFDHLTFRPQGRWSAGS
jgi:hypothetical protein